jgi:hypothetical protein
MPILASRYGLFIAYFSLGSVTVVSPFGAIIAAIERSTELRRKEERAANETALPSMM